MLENKIIYYVCNDYSLHRCEEQVADDRYNLNGIIVE